MAKMPAEKATAEGAPIDKVMISAVNEAMQTRPD